MLTAAAPRRLLLAALLAAVASCAAFAAPAQGSHAFNEFWAHWGDGAGNGPGYVTIADFTGAQWPVFAAAIEWDRPERLNVIYQSGGCGGFDHCIDVRAEQFAEGCSTVAGRTILVRDGNHIGGANSRVRLNTRCNDRADREQRVITCHEEGHVTGLGEEPESLEAATCMGAQAGQLGQASHLPRQHDRDAIQNIYNHDG
jgi:hypothetical protein